MQKIRTLNRCPMPGDVHPDLDLESVPDRQTTPRLEERHSPESASSEEMSFHGEADDILARQWLGARDALGGG